MPPKAIEPFSTKIRLKDLGNFFLSSLGPSGKLNIFESSVGHLSVTSTSDRILRCLELSDPCGEAIQLQTQAFMGRHGDGGILLASLTCQFTSLLSESDPQTSGENAKFLGGVFHQVLLEQRRKLSFDGVSELVALSRTVLGSKGRFAKRDLEGLSIKLVDGFLRTLPASKDQGSDYSKLGIAVTTEQPGMGEDRFELVEGFLFRYPENDYALERKSLSDGKILLLDLQLKEDMLDLHEWENMGMDLKSQHLNLIKKELFEKKIEEICTFCLVNNVRAVLCQKVIDRSAEELFRKHRIWSIERLGRDACAMLASLSGAVPLNSMEFSSRNLDFSVGKVSSISDVVRSGGSKRYLHFKNNEKRIFSLRVSCLDEEQEEDIKLLCGRATDLLYSSLSSPFLLPGGGCLEACLIQSLETHAHSKDLQTRTFASKAGLIFSQIIRQLHPTACEITSDLGRPVYSRESGHLWFPSECSCVCGALKDKLGDNVEVPFFEQEFGLLTPPPHRKKEETSPLMNLSNNNNPLSLSESFLLRERLLFSALETAQSLAAVGIILKI